MATTTTNFGWDIPQSTDLVKDGATAIAALGQDIDTALVDLKGGTTGQILAKASNTDLDYSWITNDVGDITAITVTSPITGGGTSGSVGIAIQDASTSQRGSVQLSDSTSTTSSVLAATPTAVKAAYDLAAVPSAAWTTYTPTVTSQGGTITAYTSSGIYLTVGKTVYYSVSITITTAGTATGFIKASLPSTPNFAFSGSSQNTNITGVSGSAQAPSGDPNLYINNYANVTYIATGSNVVASGMYRIA